MVARRARADGWFDVATLKEPYRIEGKKTMGLEIVEQLGWTLPDVIVYPTGGGVGLIGIHKAIAELRELGWVARRRCRASSRCRPTGCAPIVDAFEQGAESRVRGRTPAPCAFGINVPKALGDFIVLDMLYRTPGARVAVSDDDCSTSCGCSARRRAVRLSRGRRDALRPCAALAQEGWIGRERARGHPQHRCRHQVPRSARHGPAGAGARQRPARPVEHPAVAGDGRSNGERPPPRYRSGNARPDAGGGDRGRDGAAAHRARCSATPKPAAEPSEAAAWEAEFAAFLGRRYAVAVNSCGCGAVPGASRLGVRPGDPVLVNSWTLAPVPGAVAHVGARAVLVETTAELTVDLDDLERQAAAHPGRCSCSRTCAATSPTCRPSSRCARATGCASSRTVRTPWAAAGRPADRHVRGRRLLQHADATST